MIGSGRKMARYSGWPPKASLVWLTVMGLIAYGLTVACNTGLISGIPCDNDSECSPDEFCSGKTAVCTKRPFPCATDVDCASHGNTVCESGECILGCNTDPSCTFPALCDMQTRHCIDACHTDADCPYGSLCENDTACGRPACKDPADCMAAIGPGLSCSGDNKCKPNFCGDHNGVFMGGCSSGFQCMLVDGRRMCSPSCTSNSDCPPGVSCGPEQACLLGG